MACEFRVCFNAGQYERATEAGLAALDLLEPLEEQMSYFRPSSQISRINREAAFAPVQVEPGLFGLLELAQRLATETNGALDITATPLWKVWGFARRAGRIPSDEEIRQARQFVGSHLMQLDAQSRTVRFLRPGVEISLGSVGKGYALDRCAARLAEDSIDHFLLHGGHSSVLARGSRWEAWSGSDDDRPSGWIVGVKDPLRPRTRLAELRLRDRALATSGSAVQFFRYRGRRYGHVLDPRTGWPAEGVLSVTVVAHSAAEADALATAFYVMGPDRTFEYCNNRPELGVLFVCPAPVGNGLQVRSMGLAEDDLRILTPG